MLADRIMATSDFDCCSAASASALVGFLANAIFFGYFLHRLRNGCQLIAASVSASWLQTLNSSTLLARVP